MAKGTVREENTSKAIVNLKVTSKTASGTVRERYSSKVLKDVRNLIKLFQPKLNLYL
jgi:uncharacterized protein YchJ